MMSSESGLPVRSLRPPLLAELVEAAAMQKSCQRVAARMLDQRLIALAIGQNVEHVAEAARRRQPLAPRTS